MTEYKVSYQSQFCNDLDGIEGLLDDLENCTMFSISKKDIILYLRRIRNQADDMIRKTQQSDYDYFTKSTEDMP